MHDGTRHHVARCEFSHRMVLRHEAAHLQVTQVRAFTAQSFREQETGSALHIQRRRVELDELQVAELAPARRSATWRSAKSILRPCMWRAIQLSCSRNLHAVHAV